MGARNTLKQQREYNRAARARDRKAGYKLRQIKVHDDDWPQVKDLAERLKAKRLSALAADQLVLVNQLEKRRETLRKNCRTRKSGRPAR
jgi:hypothetical protein